MALSSSLVRLGRAGRSLRAAAPRTSPSLFAGNRSLRPFRGSPIALADKDYNRKHSERRLLPFAPRELYNVVADIDSYCEFVPWCTESKVVGRIGQDYLVAELGVGFQILSEKYTSLVTLGPYRSVKADVPNSSLFNYLINDWTFEPGPDKFTTEITFNVEFQFRNPLYQRVTDLFFTEVVKNMVNAFEKRALTKYRNRGANFEMF
jgi:ribosome-associated toxin RatA of RatAB toxin-antitoxin module